MGSGIGNQATVDYAAVVGGKYGSASGNAAFIGAGGSETNIGPAFSNSAAGQDSFVGAGDLNQITVNGEGSFIGGGGYSYASQSATTAGNRISNTDAFIGAGDLNDVTGPQAFIGAGSQNSVSGNDAFVGAGAVNNAAAGSAYVGAGFDNIAAGGDSFVGAGGGGYFSYRGSGGTVDNAARGYDSFVGAGDLNDAVGNGSFIGAGGYADAQTGSVKPGNTASGTDSFIGAGDENVIGSNAAYSSIVGGNRNNASGEYASIIGGYGNTASGAYAIVAGGDTNTAAGTVSYAAGYHADAAHSGSFVWSDYSSGSTAVKDTAVNQFVARASGGIYLYSNEAASAGVKLAPGSGTWASLSDRASKTSVVPLDDASVLAKVDALPVSTWSYKSETGVRHAGPMAQDFYAAFGVGEDDRHITSVDEDGIALASIKALHNENGRLKGDVVNLRSRLAALEAYVYRHAR